MRQETNNEMDLLLRRLGRRPETSASTDHLDADELSSYAENVLPPASRARYTEHLAECARCRDLVVQLSSSAGVVVGQETAKAVEPSALRKFLASLFSPMVLRYAVPALGLIVVAAIGLLVSRRQQFEANAPVAQAVRQEPSQATVPSNQPEPSASPAQSTVLMDNSTAVNKQVRGNTGTENGAVAPPPPNAPPSVSSISAEASQDAQAKKTEQQQEPPKEVAAAAAPKPAGTTDDLKKLEREAQKQKDEDRVAVANEPAPVQEAVRVPKRKAEESAKAGARPETTVQPLGVASSNARTTRARDDAGEKDKNDADTRTVAGHRFRKQGNVWVDTAYVSQAIMSLRRGSEQYRSLVADEPEIKKIADQLDGEIIVVVKGRGYRIF